jgi:hypothetical protein
LLSGSCAMRRELRFVYIRGRLHAQLLQLHLLEISRLGYIRREIDGLLHIPLRLVTACAFAQILRRCWTGTR